MLVTTINAPKRLRELERQLSSYMSTDERVFYLFYEAVEFAKMQHDIRMGKTPGGLPDDVHCDVLVKGFLPEPIIQYIINNLKIKFSKSSIEYKYAVQGTDLFIEPTGGYCEFVVNETTDLH